MLYCSSDKIPNVFVWCHVFPAFRCHVLPLDPMNSGLSIKYIYSSHPPGWLCHFYGPSLLVSIKKMGWASLPPCCFCPLYGPWLLVCAKKMVFAYPGPFIVLSWPMLGYGLHSPSMISIFFLALPLLSYL